MSLEQPGPGEYLSTLLTNMSRAVSPEVHGEGRHRDIDLATLRALPGLTVHQGPVGLLVPRQIAGGRVGLLTHGALESGKSGKKFKIFFYNFL